MNQISVGEDDVHSPLPTTPQEVQDSVQLLLPQQIQDFSGGQGEGRRKGHVIDRYIVHHPSFGEEEFMGVVVVR